MLKLFNPFFWWKKRNSIIKRLLELPGDLRWKLIFPFIKSGYILNHDFDKIRELKDIHKSEIGILLGNGPSVRLEDLNKLDQYVTFGCNRLHLAYETMNLRPNYIVSADEQMISDFGQEIIDNNRDVFFVSKLRPFARGKYTWFKLKNGRPFKFSKDVQKNVMGGGGTLLTAIQIAYHMGIRKFLVYGVDHSFKFEKGDGSSYANVTGEGNHFIKGYRSGKAWQAPVTDLVEESFKKSADIMKGDNGYMYNITRGGRLEVLERKDFDAIIG